MGAYCGLQTDWAMRRVPARQSLPCRAPLGNLVEKVAVRSQRASFQSMPTNFINQVGLLFHPLQHLAPLFGREFTEPFGEVEQSVAAQTEVRSGA